MKDTNNERKKKDEKKHGRHIYVASQLFNEIMDVANMWLISLLYIVH